MPMVVPKHSAESLTALHIAVATANIYCRIDESVAEPLMIPLRVVVREILGNRPTQRPFVKEHHFVQALVLD